MCRATEGKVGENSRPVSKGEGMSGVKGNVTRRAKGEEDGPALVGNTDSSLINPSTQVRT